MADVRRRKRPIWPLALSPDDALMLLASAAIVVVSVLHRCL